MTRKIYTKVVFVLIAIFCCPLLYAQTDSKDVFNRWLTAFNSDDPAELKNFYNEMDYPYVEERAKNFRRTSGGFNLLHIVSADENSVAAI